MNVTMQCIWNGGIQQKDVIWQRTTCCLTAVVRHSVACADKYTMLKKAYGNSTKVQQAWKWLWSCKWIGYVNNKKEHIHTTAADLNIPSRRFLS